MSASGCRSPSAELLLNRLFSPSLPPPLYSLQESIKMLNSVPESMRACLIEAAKLSAPGFKKKEAAAGSELGSLGGSAGPLSFNISVDAGRAPPPPPAPARAAL